MRACVQSKQRFGDAGPSDDYIPLCAIEGLHDCNMRRFMFQEFGCSGRVRSPQVRIAKSCQASPRKNSLACQDQIYQHPTSSNNLLSSQTTSCSSAQTGFTSRHALNLTLHWVMTSTVEQIHVLVSPALDSYMIDRVVCDSTSILPDRHFRIAF